MRRSHLTPPILGALALLSAPALSLAQTSAPSAAPHPTAQTPRPASPAAPTGSSAAAPAGSSAAAPTGPVADAPEPSPDTVIAKVGPDTIHYGDLAEAMQTLPEQLRAMPPAMLYPMLLDQLVDRDIIVLQAKKDKLQDDPKVKLAISRATDLALQNALLTRDIQPLLTAGAIQDRYTKEYAGKTGEEQAHAAHILVASEDKAKEIIAKIDKGADFAALAKENSTDPSAKENSGDLGWFKKTDMLPEFSDAAFALKPGQITQTPVKTRFGWHVIKLEGLRTAPPPPIDEVRNDIRQQIIQEGVAKVLADARKGVTVERFNPDGSPYTPPAAAPGTAPGSTPGQAPAQPPAK